MFKTIMNAALCSVFAFTVFATSNAFAVGEAKKEKKEQPRTYGQEKAAWGQSQAEVKSGGRAAKEADGKDLAN